MKKSDSRMRVILAVLVAAAFGVSCNVKLSPGPADAGIEGGVVYPPAPSAILERKVAMVDGSEMALTEKRGKVLLVNLWATWCGPCIEEMPALIRMQEEFGPQGFEVVGLNTETTEGLTVEQLGPKVKSFIEEQGLNYPNGYIAEGMFDEFAKLSKLAGIPQSIIIDREGRLRGVFAGGGEKNIAKMRETAEKVLGGG